MPLGCAQGNVWRRKGWAEMDKMRSKLEDLKELRDLVRSLGRGGGWGPLRRAPIQFLDMKVRGRTNINIHPLHEQTGSCRAEPSNIKQISVRPARDFMDPL